MTETAAANPTTDPRTFNFVPYRHNPNVAACQVKRYVRVFHNAEDYTAKWVTCGGPVCCGTHGDVCHDHRFS